MGLCDRPVIELRDDGLDSDLPSGVGELRYGDVITCPSQFKGVWSTSDRAVREKDRGDKQSRTSWSSLNRLYGRLRLPRLLAAAARALNGSLSRHACHPLRICSWSLSSSGWYLEMFYACSMSPKTSNSCSGTTPSVLRAPSATREWK